MQEQQHISVDVYELHRGGGEEKKRKIIPIMLRITLQGL